MNGCGRKGEQPWLHFKRHSGKASFCPVLVVHPVVLAVVARVGDFVKDVVACPRVF